MPEVREAGRPEAAEATIEVAEAAADEAGASDDEAPAAAGVGIETVTFWAERSMNPGPARTNSSLREVQRVRAT